MLRKAFVVVLPFSLLFACGKISAPERDALATFDVEIVGIHQLEPVMGQEQVTFVDCGVEKQRPFDVIVDYARLPLQVSTVCAQTYGGQEQVPEEVRGTKDCRYRIPHGGIELEVAVTARDYLGQEMPELVKPVSFRVVPGDLVQGYEFRTALLSGGKIEAPIRAAHVYGEVRVWAEDGPPQPVTTEEGLVAPPEEPASRSFATGLSESLWFEEPTIQAVQIPDMLDNRTSPFVGQFLTIGKSPEAGGPIRHTCPDDPENDGQASLLVVTGADPQGFFVTDVTACRTKELLVDQTGAEVRTPEPNGFYPGRFASMYIYNYSYPEGLFTGDALWSVSGSVQEFTSTTQMTFPAWNIAKKVHELPASEWDQYLSRVPIADLNLRLCGGDDATVTYLTDSLCGHNRRNLKLESLESGLVRVKNVRFPEKFVACDFNGDKSVPFYCESRSCTPDDLGRTQWEWADCNFEAPAKCDPADPTSEACERQCNIDCTLAQGEHAGTRCSEKTTYEGFGQYVVELPGPGPTEAGLDMSLPKRVHSLKVSATSANTSSLVPSMPRNFDFQRFDPGTEVLVWCDAPVRVGFGDGSKVAGDTDTALAAKTLLSHIVTAAEPHVAIVANGDFAPTSTCSISANMRTRINLLSKDAIPDLDPDCSVDDADADRAEQCRFLRAASYDVVGHLRHLQPGRPRWAILPRDANDMCCHPGEGMACPRPLQACTN